MKNCFPALIFLMAVVCSCGKKDASTCAVNYAIDSTAHIPLVHQWQFVGFVDTVTKKTDSPLCGSVESDITFTDSLIATHTPPYYSYKYLYFGIALINYYSGSYTPGADSVSIQLSTTQNTSVSGTDDVKQFESRFHDLLFKVSSYHINNNELTLYPAGTTTVMRFKSIN